MNVYAKGGKKFLETLDNYFKEYEKGVGYSVQDLLRSRTSIPSNTPDPIKIIDSLSMFFHTGGDDLTLYFHRRHGFDGYCTFLGEDGKISDGGIRVMASDMGAWQVTLLLVLSMHVMPLYWHACYMRWTPIFCEKDLQKHRKTKRKFSALTDETYEFLPKHLPTEPMVSPIEEGREYQTSFYVWSDFGGYMKINSTIKFSEKSVFAIARDIEVTTEIEKIVPYRAHVML